MPVVKGIATKTRKHTPEIDLLRASVPSWWHFLPAAFWKTL
jgi:hypothetical protein